MSERPLIRSPLHGALRLHSHQRPHAEPPQPDERRGLAHHRLLLLPQERRRRQGGVLPPAGHRPQAQDEAQGRPKRFVHRSMQVQATVVGKVFGVHGD